MMSFQEFKNDYEMQQTERSGGWCKVLESTGAGLAEEDKHAQ
jgi:hypothetical protein